MKIKNPELNYLINHFGKIGLKRAQTRLRNSKELESQILLLFLKIEGKHIQMKHCDKMIYNSLYLDKHYLIIELIEIYLKNDFTFGLNKKRSEDNSIIFFDFDNHQLSWPFYPDSFLKFPKYKGNPDKEANNLTKIEELFTKKTNPKS